MDIVTYILCKKYAQSYTDEQIKVVSKGMTFKGSVPTLDNLPLEGNALGDLYIIESTNDEYVWASELSSGTIENWQQLGKTDLSNFYTKAEVDEIKGGLTSEINNLKSTKVNSTTFNSTVVDLRSSDATLGEAIDSVKSTKQDKINDLAEIRAGAALGKTALQEHQDISGKQDKLTAKEGSGIKLVNNQLDRDPDIIPSVDYVDMSISDTLLYVDQQDASEHAGRVAGDNLLQEQINNKQATISDLEDIRSGAALGATAVQHDELILEEGAGEKSVQTKGTLCEATGDGSVAVGLNTHAGATASFSEGALTATRNDYDEEAGTGFDAAYSHVEGLNNGTNNVAEHGEGKFGWSYYDEEHDPAKSSIHYVGVGTNDQDIYRKDAEVIMVNGDKYILGIGNYDGKNIADAETVQEVINNKQDKVGVNEPNPTVDLTSLKIGDIVYKIAGEAKLGKTFTTDITVGHLEAGTKLDANMSLADLLYEMLVGEGPEPAEIKLYYGATDNPPTSIEGLNEQVFESESEFMPSWNRNIVAGNIELEEGQHDVIALPKKYILTKWRVPGFDMDQPHTLVDTADYNIYYMNTKSYDEPEGTNYILDIEEN